MPAGTGTHTLWLTNIGGSWELHAGLPVRSRFRLPVGREGTGCPAQAMAAPAVTKRRLAAGNGGMGMGVGLARGDGQWACWAARCSVGGPMISLGWVDHC